MPWYTSSRILELCSSLLVIRAPYIETPCKTVSLRSEKKKKLNTLPHLALVRGAELVQRELHLGPELRARVRPVHAVRALHHTALVLAVARLRDLRGQRCAVEYWSIQQGS